MSQNNGMICNFKDINTKIAKLQEQIGSSVIPQTMVEITYSELKSLRDNSQLIPGCWYRITDYETTTRQSETQSAGHLFDVIVFAIDNKTLSEEAWAINHVSDEPNQLLSITITDLIGLRPKSTDFYRNPESDGDFEGNHYYGFADKNGLKFVYVKDLEEKPTKSTLYDFEGPISEATSIKNFENTSFFISSSILLGDYFANSNLSAWKLKYCLDNDIDRFKWAVDDKHEGIMIEYDRDYYTFKRYPEGDKDGKYAWVAIESGNVDNFDEISDSAWDNIYEDDIIYTNTPNPNIGDEVVWLVDEVHTNHLIYKVKKLGKGVIYRMIDEFGNDCPYDFKNIQHILPITDWLVDFNSSTTKPCYTFDQGSLDYSITGEASNNVIGSYCEYGIYRLPVIRMGSGNGNRIGVNCNNIFLGAMKGANVCQFVTDVDYQTGGKDDYHHYEWFGRARNGSVVQTNPFGTAT